MDSASALQPGARLNGYRIEDLLSADGSFSLVYRAVDLDSARLSARRERMRAAADGWRRPDGPLGYAAPFGKAPSPGPMVAIKELFPSELALRASNGPFLNPKRGKEQVYDWSRQRFLEEARFLMGQSHPNLVAVFEVFQAHNTEYMVMELLEGGSLENLVLSGAGRSEAAVRRWLHPVLRALQATQRQGVDHLDLSPQNVVFRSPGGDPVLIDFGAARMGVAEQSRATRLIVNDGYSAPEKYRLTSQGLSARTDVYALGAIVQFALTGQRPPPAPERLASGRRATPQPAGVSRRFIEAVDACFDPDPRRRPADAAAVERAVGPWDTAPASGPAALISAGMDPRRLQLVGFFILLVILLLLLLIPPAMAGEPGAAVSVPSPLEGEGGPLQGVGRGAALTSETQAPPALKPPRRPPSGPLRALLPPRGGKEQDRRSTLSEAPHVD